MKNSGADDKRLDIIVLANPSRASFGQSQAYALNVCKNERLTLSPADKSVEWYSFEE
jgi:hypothetical protein